MRKKEGATSPRRRWFESRGRERSWQSLATDWYNHYMDRVLALVPGYTKGQRQEAIEYLGGTWDSFTASRCLRPGNLAVLCSCRIHGLLAGDARVRE